MIRPKICKRELTVFLLALYERQILTGINSDRANSITSQHQQNSSQSTIWNVYRPVNIYIEDATPFPLQGPVDTHPFITALLTNVTLSCSCCRQLQVAPVHGPTRTLPVPHAGDPHRGHGQHGGVWSAVQCHRHLSDVRLQCHTPRPGQPTRNMCHHHLPRRSGAHRHQFSMVHPCVLSPSTHRTFGYVSYFRWCANNALKKRVETFCSQNPGE